MPSSSAAGTISYSVVLAFMAAALYHYVLSRLTAPSARAVNRIARSLAARADPGAQVDYDVVVVGGGESPSFTTHFPDIRRLFTINQVRQVVY